MLWVALDTFFLVFGSLVSLSIYLFREGVYDYG